MARKIPTPQQWIAQWFRAKAVQNGGVIRRSVPDVKKYASVALLRAEVKRRKFHLILCGGQYIVLCNKGQIKVLE
jgi:hypothetical protein